jgi:hypothetical protein
LESDFTLGFVEDAIACSIPVIRAASLAQSAILLLLDAGAPGQSLVSELPVVIPRPEDLEGVASIVPAKCLPCAADVEPDQDLEGVVSYYDGKGNKGVNFEGNFGDPVAASAAGRAPRGRIVVALNRPEF